MRRIINQWPFYRLQQFISKWGPRLSGLWSQLLSKAQDPPASWDWVTLILYKASWAAIPVVLVGERHFQNLPQVQEQRSKEAGLFKCKSCGQQYNADVTGAINIRQ